MKTSEAGQYRLIHHEYAGLARIEKNYGSASDYEFSNQITNYLEHQTVLKLALKTRSRQEQEDIEMSKPELGIEFMFHYSYLFEVALKKANDFEMIRRRCYDKIKFVKVRPLLPSEVTDNYPPPTPPGEYQPQICYDTRVYVFDHVCTGAHGEEDIVWLKRYHFRIDYSGSCIDNLHFKESHVRVEILKGLLKDQ
jgi:hypothetical protein